MCTEARRMPVNTLFSFCSLFILFAASHQLPAVGSFNSFRQVTAHTFAFLYSMFFVTLVYFVVIVFALFFAPLSLFVGFGFIIFLLTLHWGEETRDVTVLSDITDSCRLASEVPRSRLTALSTSTRVGV